MFYRQCKQYKRVEVLADSITPSPTTPFTEIVNMFVYFLTHGTGSGAMRI